jgi:hypothetical protein
MAEKRLVDIAADPAFLSDKWFDHNYPNLSRLIDLGMMGPIGMVREVTSPFPSLSPAKRYSDFARQPASRVRRAFQDLEGK